MTHSISPFELSIAPMMRYSDRHFRYLMRLMSRRAKVYTEMITTGALQHGNRTRLLAFHQEEHPIALQLGGSEPAALAECAKIAEDAGYDEVNLNVGCPSERVQTGNFGAALMAEPKLVAACVARMREAVKIPVTVKTRIGIDEWEGYAPFHTFIQTLTEAGCRHFIIHARKAWLKGLNPKENRTVPPLRYDLVTQLKQDFPQLTIVINGGINDTATIAALRAHIDGAMIGRAAYENPFWIASLDQTLYNDPAPVTSRIELIRHYLDSYVRSELASGTPLIAMMRHCLGLFHAQPGGRFWRRALTELMPKLTATVESIHNILDALQTN